MAKVSKRQKLTNEKVEARSYTFADAVELLQSLKSPRFVESVEATVMLGVDPRKSDQVVRGATVLPHGTGKQMRVAVFAQGPNAEAAKKAGADIVGFQDLAETIKSGTMDFDVLIASPDAMGLVGPLGRELGPRGLMPNPKLGTVTPDVAGAVEKAKGGQVRYRADKAGIVHCGIGKIDFDAKQLKENFEALVADLKKAKPSTAKGLYLKKFVLSTTMGPGLVLDSSSIEL